MRSVEAYRGLVERLEREARESPGRYRFKLALLAGLGFVVLGGSVLMALGMSVGLVLVLVAISPLLLLKLLKVVWIPVAFGWVILRALWMKFDAPDGYRLREGEAPELRAEIEHLRNQAGAPPLAGIVIDNRLNAAAASVPRAMGLLGSEHYLVLGLPLLQLLDRAQFGAVVAHEFGHFGGGHSRFGGWIYRVRESWFRVLEELELRRSWVVRLFTRFFDWYAPYFNAYSFVLARSNEYQADAMAAAIAGPESAARALVRVSLGSEQLDRDFWPGVRSATRTEPRPPQALYTDMAGHLARPGTDEAGRLRALLEEQPGLEDTHPTLSQRLAFLKVEPEPVPPPTRSAADSLLGPLQPLLEAHFSHEWREGVDEHWRQRHEQHGRDEAELVRLEALPERNDDEAMEHARLVEELRPDTDAAPLYRAALARLPDHPMGQYRLGALLLSRDDSAGVGHMRKAMDLDVDAVEPGLHQLDAYYRRRGDLAQRAVIRDRLRAMRTREIDVAYGREQLGIGDRFTRHELEGDELSALLEVLERNGRVKKAWIARKQLKGDTSGIPHHVVLVTFRGIVFSEDKLLNQLAEEIEMRGSFIVCTPGNQQMVAAKVKKASGGAVHGA